MRIRDYVFAAFATVILVVVAVCCWLAAISAVQATRGELAPMVILYGFNVLVNIGVIVTIGRVWGMKA